jgi:hypothetical protein
MNKENYENPVMEIVQFEVEDVIGNGSDGYEIDDLDSK